MEIVHLTYPVKNKITTGQVVLALGFFDGVHLGHRHLIATARKLADEKHLPLMVMTFDRHPSEVYAKNKSFIYIDTLEEKAAKMAKLGVDYLVVMKFTTAFSQISGQEFVDNVIIKLQANTVVAGFDYTYGRKDLANMDHLPAFAKGRFEIVKVAKQTVDGEKIGSTEIRRAITEGKMEEVYDLLGSHYVMSGTVGHGKRNGHKLGFPTANLVWTDKKAIPKVGVYATKTKVNNHWYNSMTSVGYNVTIDQERKIYIESNIFDFNEDIYDQPIAIKWYKYTRGEIKFDSLEQLKEQLQKDQAEIKQNFAEGLDKK
ncbi:MULTISPECIES: riboflavin biosynthesis protein RibF [Lactobacillus]|uniref:Riboflavin biosynthesis protein n=1 Tax=Lactobacillus xujianguonis TaxID=2495899 RepID=A0A437SXC1_9LACO|nr:MULTISPECIES: riboflavin biosynthesis protein RibF [Lactobacillus]RVU71568.1 riboflavin biosynthesis protein RibF [Lactobacillus xujianguonis]RVU77780.1 riboflavin biosynthesis protein RibF [Lactobacillus xujianguonis]